MIQHEENSHTEHKIGLSKYLQQMFVYQKYEQKY